MTADPIVLAILAFAGVVVAALVAGGVTLAIQLTKWYVQNQRLWFWNRQLVDHIYLGKGPPAPAPPADLFD
ncbi:hypothetical protein [Microbacterium sp. Mcb102]|uniref:hypothetical protein n=1 Tax=Microbacterium sp. Mcb102 TaxID=2926012 RepID=UPI0021C5A2D4|nr:hypothetical protein [Microbacterium sp. Mcb102]